MVSGEEGIPPQASVPDVVARGGRGSPLAVPLKKIGRLVMKMNHFEIETMLSIRLYQRFLMFVISPDYDTVMTKSFFVLILDSEGYFLTINVVGRSYPHRIVNDMSCNDLFNIWHMVRNNVSITKALDGDR